MAFTHHLLMDDQLTSLEDKAQFLIDNGNQFGKEFGEKMYGLNSAGFDISQKQLALMDKLIAEAKNPALRQPTETVGEHLGKVGQRLDDLRLTLEQAKPIETKMGPSVLNRFRDEKGNEVVAFAEHPLADEGMSIVVSGVVTRHGEFRGTRSTTIGKLQISADAMAQDAAGEYAEQPQMPAGETPF